LWRRQRPKLGFGAKERERYVTTQTSLNLSVSGKVAVISGDTGTGYFKIVILTFLTELTQRQ
jgi:hypothetical protein